MIEVYVMACTLHNRQQNLAFLWPLFKTRLLFEEQQYFILSALLLTSFHIYLTAQFLV